MANVSIKFNGKEFFYLVMMVKKSILEELLTHINQKFNDLKNDLRKFRGK